VDRAITATGDPDRASVQASEARRVWERRATECHDDLRSVLFKGLPEVLNQEIHHRHVAAVLEGLAGLPENAVVLDVGCGYGRVSAALRRMRPGWHLVGADMARPFVERYQQYVGGSPTSGVCAQLPWLPFAESTFDAAVVVTCLMYFESPGWVTALRAILQTVKPTGSLVIIEPGWQGEFIYTVGGILPRILGRRAGGPSPTGGRAFSLPEFAAGVRHAGGRLRQIWGMPVLTCLLTPLAGIAQVSPRTARRVCAASRAVDRIAQTRGAGSVYVAASVSPT